MVAASAEGRVLADGPDSLCAKAWEDYFVPPGDTSDDRIFCGKSRCAPSTIVAGQTGVCGRADTRKRRAWSAPRRSSPAWP